jgi:hypothetical protein
MPRLILVELMIVSVRDKGKHINDLDVNVKTRWRETLKKIVKLPHTHGFDLGFEVGVSELARPYQTFFITVGSS